MAILLSSSLARNLRIFTTVLTAVAQLVTLFRVVGRYKMRKFRCEDVLAVLASVGSVISVISSWMHFNELAGQRSMVPFWVHGIAYRAVVWLVRLSILLSILPFTSTSRTLRRATIFVAGLFILMCLSFIMSFVARCVSSHGLCAVPSQKAQSLTIFELIADILSDCPLIGLPIHSLRSIKLQRSPQRVIIAAFSSCILVTVVCCFRGASQLSNVLPLIPVAIDVEIACSLLVCNSLFITTLIYRVLHRNDVLSSADTNSPSSHLSGPTNAIQLTTIDLNIFVTIASSGIYTDGFAVTFVINDAEKSEDRQLQ